MQKINARNITLAILLLLILVVIALFIGKFTYSYLAPDLGDDLTTDGEVTASGDILIFSKGNNLSLFATTDNFNATSGNLTSTTNPSVRLISSSRTNDASATYYAGIKINENTFSYSTTAKTAEIILTVKDENGSLVTSSSDSLPYVTVNGISGFDITEASGAFNIVKEYPINTNSSTTGTTHTWTFTLTFVNLSTDQSINENSGLDIDVILQKDEIKVTTLAEYITNLYTVDGENGLYLHDADLTNGAEDNSLRYAGGDISNYVCFGTYAEECPEDNLYRIIGVFGGKVKLIKYDYATTDLLGTDGDYSGSNGTIFNSYYKGSMASIPWYSWNKANAATTYSKTGKYNVWEYSQLNTVNLNTNLIKNIGKWATKIATTDWVVGGMAYSSTNTVKQYYDKELTGEETYSAKIGLMYVSDYGFAASPENWTKTLDEYSEDTVKNNNWIYMGYSEWTISRSTSERSDVFSIVGSGPLALSGVNTNLSSSINDGTRPVFYLESSVYLVSGSGEAGDPFRIN